MLALDSVGADLILGPQIQAPDRLLTALHADVTRFTLRKSRFQLPAPSRPLSNPRESQADTDALVRNALRSKDEKEKQGPALRSVAEVYRSLKVKETSSSGRKAEVVSQRVPTQLE
ncbi:hypothetical protein MBM_00768 [Drepanopeziza brunnea f. sp. 'multigermtubi' MB_m1]|uniref:Uncharacterized protein n=1 Tax=Marssonina brunnea f. sp. multigermtubi (strain MB_m1) TaxID=1072389 RepID=K1WVM3_MARBU|nr:uncharacterized protein MBM_00768 [Drepanopeziza brunnea f. sp. 'multigermtubi' MB_m1]EKD21655.1 hypothetical protein MBM_00768 [Drepanopeziza brunnea f. sp. 'multigermtubi' MB_m1]